MRLQHWLLGFGTGGSALCRLYPRSLIPVWEQGGGGKSYCPWQQKKPLSNCKPTPGRTESAREMPASAADVSIIANNRNASRAEAGRGASAFMQIDEHEAGNGRARSGAALRRLFALFCPLLQFLSYCNKHFPPLYIPLELVAINYRAVAYIII